MNPVKRFLLVLTMSLFAIGAKSQLLIEDFNYPTGDTIASVAPSKGWLIASGANTNYFKASSTGLTYPGYKGSGIGNAVTFANTGQDIYKNTSAVINSGSIYSAFMFKADSAKSAGDYFYALLPQSSTTTFMARVFLRANSATHFRIGVSKGAVGANETAVYSNDSFSFANTYTVVLKYEFRNGTNNDSVKVFLFQGSIPANEPLYATAQNTGAVGAGTADATSLGRVCLRQGTAASAPLLTFDGLTVDSTWAGCLRLPAPVSSLQFTNATQQAVSLTWNKPATYIDSTYTTLVFVKASANITTANPTALPGSYNADTNFTSTTSGLYEHDAGAKCVYAGDANSVHIANLSAGTAYYAVAYVVRLDDTTYSPYALGAGATQTLVTPPSALISLNRNVTNSTNILISWTKDSYTDSIHTVMVFAKKAGAMNIGVPNSALTNYTADSLFGNGSKFQNDTQAFCIYKGDGNNVTLDNLTPATSYFIYGFVVRDADSAWSAATSASWATKSAPLPPVTNLTATGSAVTQSTITWTLPAGYSTASNSILVFVKANSAINTNPIALGATRYVANATFGAGTKAEGDTLATCAFNGKVATFTLRGLTNGTTYHLNAYVINLSDSVYSNAATLSFTQSVAPPLPVTNATFTGVTASSARIAWTKDAAYSNSRHTTLVFVKALSPVHDSIPTRTVTSYSAISTFGLGTRYQHDSSAFCAFKADTNFVVISGLTAGTTYHASIFVVEDVDSVYAATATQTSGVVLSQPAMVNIGHINSVNATTGAPDSIGKYVQLSGLVYGFNARPVGVQFTLRDNTGGINVLSTAKNFGYTVAEGDSITVIGLIGSARGTLQISTLDTIIFHSGAHTIKQPTVVTQLNESTENDLVRVNNVSFLAPPTGTTWPTNTQIIRLIRSGTGDTINIRTSGQSAIAGTPLPTTTTFDIIGVAAQLSSSPFSPFPFDGYYMVPRRASDVITIDSLSAFNLLSPANDTTLSINDTSSSNFITLTWEAAQPNNSINISAPTYTWMLDTVGGNFSNPRLLLSSTNAGLNTSLSINNNQLAQFLKLAGATFGSSFKGVWQVVAAADGFNKPSSQSFGITLINNFSTGLFEKQAANLSFLCYPNPANNNITLDCNTGRAYQVNISDITGRMVKQAESAANTPLTLSVDELEAGVYWVKVSSGNASAVTKLIIH